MLGGRPTPKDPWPDAGEGAPPKPSDQPLSPEEKVFAWRYFELLGAGYPEVMASALALRRDVDLHKACDMLANGCTVELAREILL